MAKIEVLYEHHPMRLECDKCGCALLMIWIHDRPKRVVIECSECQHQVEMEVDI